MEMFKKWLNMLSGKPVTNKKQYQEDKQQTGDQPEIKEQENKSDTSQEQDFYFAGDDSSEDSVKQDFKAVQKVAESVIDKVKSVPLPRPEIPKKGDIQTKSLIDKEIKPPKPATISKISNQFLGKIIRIVVIVVLTLILIFVLISLFRILTNRNNLTDGGPGTAELTQTPSPTPVTYQPYEPSIYANDPEILQLEEDVSVLDAELFRANIKDPVVRPPGLDFNISF